MEVEDLKDSAKTWFNDKVKSPYFASVIAVWLVTNRVVVFGLFNFDEKQSLQERVLWIHQQLQGKTVWWFSGFYGIILYSFIAGLVTMVVYNYVNVFGKVIYKTLGKWAIKLQQNIEPSKWVPIKDIQDLSKQNKKIEDEIEQRKNEVAKLKQETEGYLNTIKILSNEKITFQDTIEQLKKDIRTLDEVITKRSNYEDDNNRLINENNSLRNDNLNYLNQINKIKSELTQNKTDKENTEHKLKIIHFLQSQNVTFFDTVMTFLQKAPQDINTTIPPHVIDYYIENGAIKFENKHYVLTEFGKECYDEYKNSQFTQMM